MTETTHPIVWLRHAGQRLGLVPSLGGSVAAWADALAPARPASAMAAVVPPYSGGKVYATKNGVFTFSTIRDRFLIQLNLAAGTYTQSAVPFWSEPDNLRLLDGVVYLCTDNDDIPGDAVWRWDDTGASRMFYETGHSYPAGVDFALDNKVMYVSMYGDATYQITRTDGMSFAEFRNSLRDEIVIQRLRQSFAQSRISVSEGEVDAALKQQASLEFHMLYAQCFTFIITSLFPLPHTWLTFTETMRP